MKTNYVIGNVIAVRGLKVQVLMHEKSNLETFHYDGNIYEGVSVGSYIGIIRGSNKIICRVDREFLEDKDDTYHNHEFKSGRFQRMLEVSLIGIMNRKKFEFGIKRFPMLYNEVVLLSQEEILKVLQNVSHSPQGIIDLGKIISSNLDVKLSWEKLFNTHIGIFGNTGSGKSNTLAKIYSELFNLEKTGIIKSNFDNASKFIFIDFNGEYIGKEIFSKEKQIINLNTQDNSGDKLILSSSIFWDVETLSIIFSATEKTQKPLLKNAIKFCFDKQEKSGEEKPEDISIKGIKECVLSAFYNVFSKNNNKESLVLLKRCLNLLEIEVEDEQHENYPRDEEYEELLKWLNSHWHSSNNTYYYYDTPSREIYFNNKEKDEIMNKRELLNEMIEDKQLSDLSLSTKIEIVIITRLIFELSIGTVNYDHVSPLVSRIQSNAGLIDKTIELKSENKEEKFIEVISLRNCNAEAKKMFPLLISKQLYEEHKKEMNENEISKTVHLIIDEAHNILSEQSKREMESWKDYRLEVFEEMIKEGRKFGFYLTISSQRPSDISPTIISQLHNYFIYRLVNERDLAMIMNTVSSMDETSKGRTPTLAAGQCIVTGTSFELPILVQVEKLEKSKSPISESADLTKLWLNNTESKNSTTNTN